MDRYFRVKSSSGIFLSCGLLLGAGIFSCLRSKFFMLDFCARSCLLTTVLAFINKSSFQPVNRGGSKQSLDSRAPACSLLWLRSSRDPEMSEGHKRNTQFTR